jgi:hypothetical protein
MTLQQALSNPYFKVQNCSDISDLEYAITEIRLVIAKYPDSMRAKMIYSKLANKKDKLEA